MLILNLHALFAVSLYTTSNSIAVNTLVSIAMVQFVISVLFQTILCRKLRSTTLLMKLKLKLLKMQSVQFDAITAICATKDGIVQRCS